MRSSKLGKKKNKIKLDCRLYLVWKHFILIWAVYSSFFTPMEFGFFRGLPEKIFLLDIAGQFAFLIDIFLRFFLAYRDVDSHCIVYNRNQIAVRYLSSRFTLDLLACLPWDYIYKVIIDYQCSLLYPPFNYFYDSFL